MNTLSAQEAQELVNAIQLCIKSRIADTQSTSAVILALTFDAIRPDDTGLTLVQRLLPGTWELGGKSYAITSIPFPVPLMTQFLLLSRLNIKNMMKLAELDERYRPLLDMFDEQLGSDALMRGTLQSVTSIPQAAQCLFAAMKQQQMTIRAVADAAGVTQVTVSKFKAGGDVMLSTFLKIAKAVGLQIVLKRS